jgi:hypothetical protein
VAGVVIGQLSALTALAFYFGWAHEAEFLGYFGLSTSAVNLSTTDYLLNGVSVAYWPLMLLGVLVVLAQAAHPRIRARVTAWPRPERRLWLGGAVLVGVTLLMVALVGLLQVWIFPRPVPMIPLLITSGVTLITYSAVLASLVQPSGSTLPDKAQFVALAGLIAGGTFWIWASYASQSGRSDAEGTAAQLVYRTDVTVFSADRLLLAGPGIHVDSVGDEQSKYHFRYTGLRMLVRSDNRYFLLPKNWRRGADAVVVLSESDDVRLQFVAPPYP